MRLKQKLAALSLKVRNWFSRVAHSFRFRKGNVWDQILRLSVLAVFFVIIGVWAANLYLPAEAPRSESEEMDTLSEEEELSTLVRRELENLLETEYAWVLELSTTAETLARQAESMEAQAQLQPVEPPVDPRPEPTQYRDERELDEPAEEQELETLSVSFERIIWPIKGEVATAFGWHRHPEHQDWRFNNGLIFQAEPESGVRTVLAGRVAETTARSDGFEVVIQHGSGWMSVYRSIRDLAVSPGEMVEQNQTIGHSGSQGNVFFSLRYNGEPVDPQAFMR